jgi:hypothetical protein
MKRKDSSVSSQGYSWRKKSKYRNLRGSLRIHSVIKKKKKKKKICRFKFKTGRT